MTPPDLPPSHPSPDRRPGRATRPPPRALLPCLALDEVGPCQLWTPRGRDSIEGRVLGWVQGDGSRGVDLDLLLRDGQGALWRLRGDSSFAFTVVRQDTQPGALLRVTRQPRFRLEVLDRPRPEGDPRALPETAPGGPTASGGPREGPNPTPNRTHGTDRA